MQSSIIQCARLVLLPLLTTLGGSACVPDSLAPSPDADASRLYWELTLDHDAVTLSTTAPYDTLTIVATSRTVDGDTLPGDVAPTFTSSDNDHVQVDAHGVLRAVGPAQNVVVIATLTRGDLTHSDTVFVTVTTANPVPVLDALSIQPAPGDSAKFALTGSYLQPQKAISAVLTDRAHQQLSGLAVHYASLVPLTAEIDPISGLIKPIRVGHVTFTASATAYGITRADTLDFEIGLPLAVPVAIQRGVNASGHATVVFVPSEVVVGVGGDVFFQWFDPTAPSTDITFDDPSKVDKDDALCLLAAPFYGEDMVCTMGNIAAFTRDTTPAGFIHNQRLRQFRTPGTYHFRSTFYGTEGTITVQAEPSASPMRAGRVTSVSAVHP